MTRLTSNSTLKLRVSTVGQVNSRGKTMCTGIGQPWHTEPSAIWMFWISVASRACPSAYAHVSTRTSCSSIDLIVAEHSSTVTEPVSGCCMLQTFESIWPVILNVGMRERADLRTFSSDSGTIEKSCGLILGVRFSGTSRMNSTDRFMFLCIIPRRTSTVITYCVLMYTPWYDSSSFSPSVSLTSNSNSNWWRPSGSLPAGSSTALELNSFCGLIVE
mmetsp:Transcript_48994/g.135906  ORF Transcript_48994/g.135906 Transcript_48994/m.135906 type:complete len:217 (-) Transcript_48994:203-853(-)